MVPNSRTLIAEFTKMSGAGNDFIVLDNRFYCFSSDELSAIAKYACRRRHGIGADGILALSEAHSAKNDYRMIYHNADGSEGTMCGNGARCLARYAREAGFDKETVTIETASGNYSAYVPNHPASEVRIWFEKPKRWQSEFQLEATMPKCIADVHFLWSGTEHLVCFTASMDELSIDDWGPVLRADRALGKEGANVNFAELMDASTLQVRTYEKGVEAETQACGTGAIACTAAAVWTHRIEADRVAVHMPGGLLHVGVYEDRMYLEGPATVTYRGSIEIPPTCLQG